MNIVEGPATDLKKGLRHRYAGMVISLIVALAFLVWPADEALCAAITIAGNGPELRMVERLTRAFEKQHLGTVAEIRWDPSFQPTHMVKSGEADLAVTGQIAPDLVATPIAWDGIAVVVDFANPLREITSLQLAAMIRVLHEEPVFAELFMAYLLAHTIRVEEDLVDQLFNSSEKRLARVLLLLAHFGKEGKPETVITKISQETLAEMIGTTRSRVSFFMNKFRKMGFIDYNGELHVHSSLLNIVLHD